MRKTPDRINDAVLIGTFDSGSPEWHEARATGIGGSEIAAVVGLSPWESRYSLYHRKLDQLRPVAETDPMKWGTLLEPVIYAEYQSNHLPPGATMSTGATFRHIDHPWMIGNPDGLIWVNGELVDGLEIKAPGVDREEKWGPSGSDIVPVYYRCQIAWYCMVLGLDSMVLRALIGGQDARSYRIRPSNADRDFLLAEGQQFWDDLQNGVLPNLDDHTATYRAVRELHPDIDRSITANVSSSVADRWWAAQDALSQATAAMTAMKSELTTIMGTAWKATCGDESVAYRIRPRQGADSDPYIKSAARPKENHVDIAPQENDCAA